MRIKPLAFALTAALSMTLTTPTFAQETRELSVSTVLSIASSKDTGDTPDSCSTSSIRAATLTSWRGIFPASK